MIAKRLAMTAGAALASLLWVSATPAQVPGPGPAPPPAAAFAPGQLDQMLAPIALYPDGLLGQILMAAGYPLDVVQADRWLQEPGNSTLAGASLTAALDALSWDPSVKSLVPFPRVLQMMDGQLDWTERLGEAFIADPAAVTDAIQRLRRQARADGKLNSNSREIVTDQDGVITIEPAGAQTVYIPEYKPAVVYGPWPYPDWPPYDFPGYFGDCVFDPYGYCWFGEPIVVPLWGWNRWDWRGHRIDVDVGRFTGLNRGRGPVGGGVWRHDPVQRHDVPYRSPETRGLVQGGSGASAAARASRGYPTGSVERAPSQEGAPRAAPPVMRVPPTVESYGRGADVRMQAERGQSSRATMPSSPRGGGGGGGGAPRGAPPTTGSGPRR